MPDVVHRCYNAVQRGTTWPCTLTAYAACMRCVCVCVLHVSPWFAQPGRSLGLLLGETEQREHRKKKKNRTPRDAKQEHFWTLTHFKSFYIPSHQLHINFVRRMAPGTRPRSPPIAIQVAALGIRGDKQVKHPYENYWKNNLKNSWNDVFDCKIIQNSIAMASLNGKSQWQVSTDSWTDSI